MRSVVTLTRRFAMPALSTLLLVCCVVGCATHGRALPDINLRVLFDTTKSRSELIRYARSVSMDSSTAYLHDTVIGVSFFPVLIYGYPGELYISKWFENKKTGESRMHISWRLTPYYMRLYHDSMGHYSSIETPVNSNFDHSYDSLCTKAGREFAIQFSRDTIMALPARERRFYIGESKIEMTTDTVIYWYLARKRPREALPRVEP